MIDLIVQIGLKSIDDVVRFERAIDISNAVGVRVTTRVETCRFLVLFGDFGQRTAIRVDLVIVFIIGVAIKRRMKTINILNGIYSFKTAISIYVF